MLKYILASDSPRRKELMKQANLKFEVKKNNVEEYCDLKEPQEICMELSKRKARKVYMELVRKRDIVVIGADTIVCKDGVIYGKPKNMSEAFRMIKSMAGTSHEVYTGITLYYKLIPHMFYEKTIVTVYEMTDEEIWNYIESESPFDKAGAYGIQDSFAAYIKSIEGDYNNVVGLPLGRLCFELKKLEESVCYKGCIFDLDGTLVDSLHNIAENVNMSLEKYGLMKHSVELYKNFIGYGARELIRKSLLASGDDDLKFFSKVYYDYEERFRENCTKGVVPCEGIVELLEELKKKGIHLAVLSNKKHENTVKVVEEIFGKDMFEFVLGERPEMFKRKPCGDGLVILAGVMGIEAEECLYLGDGTMDMEAGRDAGMDAVGVTWGFRIKEELVRAGARYIIHKPQEILAYYEKKRITEG